jgi:hypothetical protein
MLRPRTPSSACDCGLRGPLRANISVQYERSDWSALDASLASSCPRSCLAVRFGSIDLSGSTIGRPRTFEGRLEVLHGARRPVNSGFQQQRPAPLSHRRSSPAAGLSSRAARPFRPGCTGSRQKSRFNRVEVCLSGAPLAHDELGR